MSNTVPGTNVAPISFPGIASGIDYNSIIQKLTALRLSQNTAYNTQITGLASANAELIKINGLFVSVQNALTAISSPTLLNAISATSSNPSLLTALGIPNVTATPGTYQILGQRLATASSVTGFASYGHAETDNLGGSPATTHVLSGSYTQITPSNGDPTKGGASVTIDGIKIGYDVNVDSVSTILAKINNAIGTTAVDPGFTASLAPGTDTIVFKSTDQPITLGSPADNGNLLQVFKLDQAQLVNTGASGLITATGGIGGVNPLQVLNYTNQFSQQTNANYVTAVTAGTFTINGVTIAVDPTKDAVSDVIKRINASTAGVTAAFNNQTGKITITNTATGPQSIVLGAGGDTSNFLSASGLTGPGVTSTIGQQASVTVTNPGGTTSTVYSNSNAISTAIPGVTINVLQTSASTTTLTVGSDSSSFISAVNTFVTAYNAAINEINTATVAPTVVAAAAGSGGRAQSVGGGVLYNNADVLGIKDALTNIITGFSGSQTTGYNSLQSIGLNVSSSFTVLAPSGSGNTQGPITQQTLGGTDGTISPLDVTKFAAAFAANPAQVQAIFGSSGTIGSLGAYLTGVTGQPTTLYSGLAGTIPSVSLLQNFENSNSSELTSLQAQVKLVTDGANQYADQLRAQFTSYEGQIAQYQSLQSQLAGFFKNG